MDIVIVLHAYFSSQLSMLNEVSAPARVNFIKYTNEFLGMSEHLLNQPNDADLRLKERTMIVSSLLIQQVWLIALVQILLIEKYKLLVSE